MGDNTKRLIVVLACLLVFLTFHNYLESLFNLVIGDRIFTSNWYYDIIFSFFWIVATIEIIKRIKLRYHPTFGQVLFFGGLCFIHSYYRFNDDWLFIRFRSNYPVAYLDLAYVPLVFLFRYGIGLISPKKTLVSEAEFIEDSEVSKEDEDKLNRIPFADKIAVKILNQKFKKSFSIGLVGPWGSGKTSFMRMIENKIKSNNGKIITIRFNPFYNDSSDDIINEYFTLLSNELSKYSGQLSNAINKYKDLLLLFADDKEKGVFDKVDNLFNGELKSIQQRYDEINTVLIQIDYQIIVFIDDLDRLRPKEIIQILKIIRNTGDFHNTVYLVTYDKDYLLNALKKYSGFDDSSFSQKYFQYEFLLPSIDIQLLKDRFRSLVKDLLDEENYQVTDKASYIPTLGLDYDAFEANILTLRDVTRLVNTFRTELSFVKGEVDVSNFIDLMILKTKYSGAYQMLSLSPKRYLEPYFGFFGNYNKAFTLKKVDKDEGNEVKIIHELRQSSYSYSDVQLVKVKELLKSLFPDDDALTEESNLLIRHPKNIDTYFNLRLITGSLSERKFTHAINSSLPDFISQLNFWLEEVRFNQIINRISIQKIENETQLKNIIGGIFYLGRNLSDDTVDGQIDRSHLVRILLSIKIDFEFNIPDLIKEEYLSKPEPPYRFEFDLINSFFKRDSNLNWEIDKPYLKRKAEMMFESYLASLDSINWHVYRLFHQVFDMGAKEFAKENLISFIKKKDHLKFLSDIIDRDAIEKRYRPSSILQKMFSDGQFVAFLEELTDSSKLREFKKFYRLFELHGGDFSKYIFFDFKQISLRDFGSPHISTDVSELFMWVSTGVFEYIEHNNNELFHQHNAIHIQLLKDSHLGLRHYGKISKEDFLSHVYELFQAISEDVTPKFEIEELSEWKMDEDEVLLTSEDGSPVGKIFLFQSGEF